MSMGYAEKVRQVYALMADLNVSLYDLELMGHLDDRDDLKGTPEEAVTELVNDHFDLVGDPYAVEHYHQATADYVGDALAKAGLIDPD